MSDPAIRLRRVGDPRLADLTVSRVTDARDATIRAAITSDPRLADASVYVSADRRQANEFIFESPGTSLFLPTDDPTGLAAWYRADSLSSVDGASVEVWPDSSGNGRTMSQPGAAERPTFHTGVRNGLPVLRFNGTSQYLRNTSPFVSGDRGTIFVVCRAAAISFNHTLVSSGDNASNTRYVAISALAFGLNAMTTSQRDNDTPDQVHTPVNSMNTTNWFIVEAASNQTSFATWLDGIPQTLTVLSGSNNGHWFAATSSRDDVSIGAQVLSTIGSFWNGDIAEVIIYDAVSLTSAQRTDIRRYLGAKYAIAVP